MAASFRTDLATMQTASSHVFSVNDGIQQQLTGLLNRLEPLMGTWQGDASLSFQTLKTRWNENATQLNQALRGIGDGLVSNTASYGSAESENTSSFTGISGALG